MAVLPVEDAVVTLETVVLAVAVEEGLVVAVVGLDAVGAGREVEGAVAGLETKRDEDIKERMYSKNKLNQLNFVVHLLLWQRSKHET